MPVSSFVQMIKARELFKSLGGKVAGGYLRNREFTFPEALAALGLRNRFNLT